MRFLILIITALIFAGCAQKIDKKILATSYLNKVEMPHTVYTYDSTLKAIEGHFFSYDNNKDIQLRHMIKYLPVEYSELIYDPFSSIAVQLYRISGDRNKGLEEVLEDLATENNNQRLFKDQDKYVIDTDIAEDLIRVIDEFEIKMDRNNNDEDGSGSVFIPAS